MSFRDPRQWQLNQLKQFAASFKLSTPVPLDIRKMMVRTDSSSHEQLPETPKMSTAEESRQAQDSRLETQKAAADAEHDQKQNTTSDKPDSDKPSKSTTLFGNVDFKQWAKKTSSAEDQAAPKATPPPEGSAEQNAVLKHAQDSPSTQPIADASAIDLQPNAPEATSQTTTKGSAQEAVPAQASELKVEHIESATHEEDRDSTNADSETDEEVEGSVQVASPAHASGIADEHIESITQDERQSGDVNDSETDDETPDLVEDVENNIRDQDQDSGQDDSETDDEMPDLVDEDGNIVREEKGKGKEVISEDKQYDSDGDDVPALIPANLNYSPPTLPPDILEYHNKKTQLGLLEEKTKNRIRMIQKLDAAGQDDTVSEKAIVVSEEGNKDLEKPEPNLAKGDRPHHLVDPEHLQQTAKTTGERIRKLNARAYHMLMVDKIGTVYAAKVMPFLTQLTRLRVELTRRLADRTAPDLVGINKDIDEIRSGLDAVIVTIAMDDIRQQIEKFEAHAEKLAALQRKLHDLQEYITDSHSLDTCVNWLCREKMDLTCTHIPLAQEYYRQAAAGKLDAETARSTTESNAAKFTKMMLDSHRMLQRCEEVVGRAETERDLEVETRAAMAEEAKRIEELKAEEVRLAEEARKAEEARQARATKAVQLMMLNEQIQLSWKIQNEATLLKEKIEGLSLSPLEKSHLKRSWSVGDVAHLEQQNKTLIELLAKLRGHVEMATPRGYEFEIVLQTIVQKIRGPSHQKSCTLQALIQELAGAMKVLSDNWEQDIRLAREAALKAQEAAAKEAAQQAEGYKAQLIAFNEYCEESVKLQSKTDNLMREVQAGMARHYDETLQYNMLRSIYDRLLVFQEEQIPQVFEQYRCLQENLASRQNPLPQWEFDQNVLQNNDAMASMSREFDTLAEFFNKLQEEERTKAFFYQKAVESAMEYVQTTRKLRETSFEGEAISALVHLARSGARSQADMESLIKSHWTRSSEPREAMVKFSGALHNLMEIMAKKPDDEDMRAMNHWDRERGDVALYAAVLLRKAGEAQAGYRNAHGQGPPSTETQVKPADSSSTAQSSGSADVEVAAPTNLDPETSAAAANNEETQYMQKEIAVAEMQPTSDNAKKVLDFTHAAARVLTEIKEEVSGESEWNDEEKLYRYCLIHDLMYIIEAKYRQNATESTAEIQAAIMEFIDRADHHLAYDETKKAGIRRLFKIMNERICGTRQAQNAKTGGAVVELASAKVEETVAPKKAPAMRVKRRTEHDPNNEAPIPDLMTAEELARNMETYDCDPISVGEFVARETQPLKSEKADLSKTMQMDQQLESKKADLMKTVNKILALCVSLEIKAPSSLPTFEYLKSLFDSAVKLSLLTDEEQNCMNEFFADLDQPTDQQLESEEVDLSKAMRRILELCEQIETPYSLSWIQCLKGLKPTIDCAARMSLLTDEEQNRMNQFYASVSELEPVDVTATPAQTEIPAEPEHLKVTVKEVQKTEHETECPCDTAKDKQDQGAPQPSLAASTAAARLSINNIITKDPRTEREKELDARLVDEADRMTLAEIQERIPTHTGEEEAAYVRDEHSKEWQSIPVKCFEQYEEFYDWVVCLPAEADKYEDESRSENVVDGFDFDSFLHDGGDGDQDSFDFAAADFDMGPSKTSIVGHLGRGQDKEELESEDEGPEDGKSEDENSEPDSKNEDLSKRLSQSEADRRRFRDQAAKQERSHAEKLYEWLSNQSPVQIAELLARGTPEEVAEFKAWQARKLASLTQSQNKVEPDAASSCPCEDSSDPNRTQSEIVEEIIEEIVEEVVEEVVDAIPDASSEPRPESPTVPEPDEASAYELVSVQDGLFLFARKQVNPQPKTEAEELALAKARDELDVLISKSVGTAKKVFISGAMRMADLIEGRRALAKIEEAVAAFSASLAVPGGEKKAVYEEMLEDLLTDYKELLEQGMPVDLEKEEVVEMICVCRLEERLEDLMGELASELQVELSEYWGSDDSDSGTEEFEASEGEKAEEDVRVAPEPEMSFEVEDVDEKANEDMEVAPEPKMSVEVEEVDERTHEDVQDAQQPKTQPLLEPETEVESSRVFTEIPLDLKLTITLPEECEYDQISEAVPEKPTHLEGEWAILGSPESHNGGRDAPEAGNGEVAIDRKGVRGWIPRFGW